MKDNYEHIHLATNSRLAKMLLGSALAEKSNAETTNDPTLKEVYLYWYELYSEAASRLEAFDKRPMFNHEPSDNVDVATSIVKCADCPFEGSDSVYCHTCPYG